VPVFLCIKQPGPALPCAPWPCSPATNSFRNQSLTAPTVTAAARPMVTKRLILPTLIFLSTCCALSGAVRLPVPYDGLAESWRVETREAEQQSEGAGGCRRSSVSPRANPPISAAYPCGQISAIQKGPSRFLVLHSSLPVWPGWKGKQKCQQLNTMAFSIYRPARSESPRSAYLRVSISIPVLFD
jgi:hypothetical protein